MWYSYLPMAHIFERAVHIVIMQVGAQWWFRLGFNNVAFIKS